MKYVCLYSQVSTSQDDHTRTVVIEPSPLMVVFKKVVASMTCVIIFVKFLPMYPLQALKDDDFLENTSLLYKFWYLNNATLLVRFKYYFAWLFADAICNNLGMGFNGYNDDGSAKWNKLSNIDIIGFEVSVCCIYNICLVFGRERGTVFGELYLFKHSWDGSTSFLIQAVFFYVLYICCEFITSSHILMTTESKTWFTHTQHQLPVLQFISYHFYCLWL